MAPLFEGLSPGEVEETGPARFVHHSVHNRSLGTAGRVMCVVALGSTILGIAAAMAAIGAWPVLPFAGLEVAFVALAFHRIAVHDGDFERLEVAGDEVRYEARRARCVTRVVANGAWARFEVEERGAGFTMALRYAGRTVPRWAVC